MCIRFASSLTTEVINVQESDINLIIEKVLNQIEKKEDYAEKLLFINKIHSGKGTVSVRISKEAFDMAKIICDENDMSVNAYVTSAVAERLFNDLSKVNQK